MGRWTHLKTKWRFATAGLFIALCSVAARAAEPVGSENKIVLKWLGVVGWEIRVGKTVVLIDPFLTRRSAARDQEWKTDEEAVLKAVAGADYIFVGHSHADHVADVPFIAKRFGAKVIGSRTTTNLALTAGVDKAQLTTIQGGEKFDFQDFSVEVVESRHGISQTAGRTEVSEPKELGAPRSGPLLGRHFVEGGSFLYNFSFGKHRVLHQSTANFVEEKLAGLNPDVALLAEPGRGYNLKNALQTLKPKVIIIQHYDDWRMPFSQGLPSDHVKRAERFKRYIEAVDGRIKVIIPDFFMTYALE
ncbi:MAG TPA: MBL fold metallo-hydrolase [Candidatus Binatia bacterium]